MRLNKEDRDTLCSALGFPHTLAQKDLASAFGVTPQAICRWQCPRNDDGTYDLPVVFEWQEQRIAAAFVSEGPDKDEYDRRYRKAKAERLELELQKIRGDLVPTTEVVEELGRLLEGLKQDLLRLPAALAPELESRTAQQIHRTLDARVRAAIEKVRACPWMTAKAAQEPPVELTTKTQKSGTQNAEKPTRRTRVKRKAPGEAKNRIGGCHGETEC